LKEILFVVDGDKPKIFNSLRKLAAKDQRIRIIKFAKSFGEATAISAGFRNSKGQVILTLPAYYQVEPGSIKTLVNTLVNCDMAVGRIVRSRRQLPVEYATPTD